MIERDTDIRSALRSRQRGMLLNPYRFGAASHGSSGALVGSGAALSGSAAHIAVHGSSGALVGSGAALSGSASRSVTDPYWTSVKLLVPGNGANNGTTFTDVSSDVKTLTPTGNVITSTAQYKWNGSSMYFDGNGDYLTLGGTAITIGTSDYCIEFWLRPQAVNATRRIITNTTGGFTGTSCLMRQTSGGKMLAYAGGASGNCVTTTSMSADTWYYSAAERISGLLKVAHQGTWEASESSSTNLSSAISKIGGYYTTGDTEYYIGYLQDIRITVRTGGRYNHVNFSVPTAPHPTS